MQLLLDRILNSLEIVFLPQISLSFSSIFFYYKKNNFIKQRIKLKHLQL